MYFFVLSFIIFNFILFLHEFGRYVTSIKFGVKVNEFSFGLGPRIFKIGKNESIYSLRAIPVGFFCSLEENESSDRSFNKKSNLKKVIILLSSLFIDTILCFILSICSSSLQNNICNTKISGFFQHSMSDSRGKLKIGDEIISINGYKTHIDVDVLFAITSSSENNFTFHIVRNGEFIKIDNVSFPTYESNGKQVSKLDFTLCKKEKNFINIMIYSSTKVGSLTRMFIKKLLWLITKHLSVRDFHEQINLVTQIDNSENAQYSNFIFSIINLIHLGMVISISLCLINFIPIHPFSSYVILLILIEKVTKRKVNTYIKELINIISFIFIISMFFLVIINDILKIIKGL